MTIDFSFPPDVEEVRMRVREFMATEVKPRESDGLWEDANRRKLVETIIDLRGKAHDARMGRHGAWADSARSG